MDEPDDKNIEEAIRRSKMKNMLGTLRELDEALPEVELPAAAGKARKRTLKLWWAAAAGILLLAVVGWYLLQDPPMTEGERLFAQNFEPYPTIGVVRGAPGDAQRRGYEAYNAGNFEEAAELLQAAREAQPDEPLLLFYLGIAQIAAGEVDTGISSLESFQILTDELQEEASHYIVLGKIRKGELGEEALEEKNE